MEKIISVTDLVRNAASIAEEIEAEGTVYRITRDGRSSMVLVNEHYFNGWMAALDEMRRPDWRETYDQTSRDIAAGRGRSLDVVAKELGLEGHPHTARGAPELVPPGVVGPHGTLLIGDLHGTHEIPAFVGRLVATLVAREPVVLALEIRPDLAPSIDAYVASDGGPAARAAALRDPWWHDIQDGRGSVAMFELLETVRRLREGHADVRVELFDPGIPDEERPARREGLMADHLIAVRRAHPAAILVVYAGNLHTIRRGVEFRPGYEWMAMRMARAGIAFVSLDVHYDTGTAWLCREASVEDCGPEVVRGHHDERGIHLAPSSDGNYDGWCGVGPITASPPAGRPELALDLDATLAELLRAYHARPPRTPDHS